MFAGSVEESLGADIKYIVDIAANVGFISSFFITVPYMIAQLRLRSLPSYSI